MVPVLFIGHGSPMRAIHGGKYAEVLGQIALEIEKPKAVLVISAHWLTAGTYITSAEQPRTIHDFYGFPEDLFKIQYPASGSPVLALEIQSKMASSFSARIHLDNGSWGFDHGNWAVMKYLYPKADIPVLQLSIDMSESPAFHFSLGEKLRYLRDQGVLVVASGNIVHNLRKISFREPQSIFPWNKKFDEWVDQKVNDRDFKALIYNYRDSEEGALSVPTDDHYFPFLYFLGLTQANDKIESIYQELEYGSLSMRSYIAR